MRKKIFIISLFAAMFTCFTFAQNFFNGPECVSYDLLNNRYIVSNWTNGNIVSIDSTGNQSYFITGLGHAYGNLIKDSTLYVSNGTSILGFNLFNPLDTVVHIQVASASQMDGITLDNNNNLYAVDVIQALVFKANLSNLTSSIFSTGLSARPQDIIFDEKNNQLLVCSWYSNSPIQAISLTDSSVTNVVTTIYGNCDGLAQDESGNVYFSTWTDNSVYYYDSTFTNPPTKLSDAHNGPSNICYNYKYKIIAVPNFNSNTLQLVPINPTSVVGESYIISNFNLTQNYPNPFNPSTKIRYEIPGQARNDNTMVTLKVYDVLGNEIATLVNEEKPAGTYEVEFDGADLPSGIYFYQLKVYPAYGRKGIFSETKKMVLLR
jgi:hypothetical protein